MKNTNLQADLTWMRSGTDCIANAVIINAEEYIEFLEGKEDRLTKMEDVLNSINDATDLPNKDVFIAKFKEFFNEG